METIATPPAKEFELRSLAALLRRQMRIIIYTALVLFGLAAAFLMTVTETYTATALILVDPDQKNILNPRNSYPSNSGRENSRIDSEVEILRSDAVALAVIERAKLVGDPEFGSRLPLSEEFARAVGIAHAAPANQGKATAKTLDSFKRSISIRRRGLTYLIAISTTSTSPEKAADLSNEISAAYIEQQVQAKVSASLAARDVLQSQIEASRNTLATYELDLDGYVENNLDLIEIGEGQDQLALLRSKLTEAELALQEKQSSQNTAHQFIQQENWFALSTSFGDETIAKLGAERQALLTRISQADPTISTVALHSKLTALEAELNSKSILQIQTLSAEVQNLNQNIGRIRGQMRQAVLASDLSPEMLTEIYAVQQEIIIARTQYKTLVSRMQDLETQAHIQIADSRVVSPALEPISPTFPNKGLVLLVTLVASMGIGVSLALMNEYYIGGITTATHLSELLQAPTATTIPQSTEQNSGRLSIAENIIDAPLSVYSESIRKLRASVDQSFRSLASPLKPAALEQSKTILVTSALPNEGKTTTALALARTYAQSGRKTLLIDADLRKPSLHHHLGFEPQFGFLDYLLDSSQTDLSASFYARDPASDLALILGAARSEFPTDQLLSSTTFKTLLAQAGEVYDVVIIDSPPLLPVVDARYIAHYADAVVMVVKWAATNQTDLKSAVMPLRAAMKPGAAFLPVLGQVRGQPNRPSYAGYSTGYSAAT